MFDDKRRASLTCLPYESPYDSGSSGNVAPLLWVGVTRGSRFCYLKQGITLLLGKDAIYVGRR